MNKDKFDINQKNDIIKNIGYIIEYINKSYQEWWRDWPYETQQPAYKCMVLIPANNLKDKKI